MSGGASLVLTAWMAASVATPPAFDFGRNVMPILDKYCTGCHGAEKKKADLSLEIYRGKGDADLIKDIHVWRGVAERLDAREMPPEEKRQPTAAEVETILGWVEAVETRAAAQGARDPGRVTIRRLNRLEYDNTVRDLLGIDLHPARDFPADDVGYGFDNIGDVLSMPPVLVERYLDAADRIVERAIVGTVSPEYRRITIEAERLSPTPLGSSVHGGVLVVPTPASVRASHEFPGDAHYWFRLKAAAIQDSGRARVVLNLDGREVGTFDVSRPGIHSVRADVTAGTRRIDLAIRNVTAGVRRAVGLDFLRIDGPLDARPHRLPTSHTRIIPRHPSEANWRQEARDSLTLLATRAYRRPAEPAEVDRLVHLVAQAMARGEPYERGVQDALRAILVSPHFLFRVEPDGVDDHQLASRLSYFLWSSMPDDHLFHLAADGSLRKDEVLEAEARRMLNDPRSRTLVESFAGQWLQTRRLAGHRASPRRFPRFDDDLRDAMIKETDLFVESVMREGLPLVTLLDADFTFLNERLAQHYGIGGVQGPLFRRVSLAGTPRGGLATLGSVLTVTSSFTRTSPVKRGRWLLEQLLGTPPPPPPPGVPDLDDNKKTNAGVQTVRQQLEAHRANPSCSPCHKKMDPLGFGLENFDAVGAWRDTEEGGVPVDASGVLPNGQRFNGPAELRAVLRAKAPAFRRTLATKLLTYALGRGTEPFDRAAIDQICRQTLENGDTFSALVLAIVKSDPFQKRREEKQP